MKDTIMQTERLMVATRLRDGHDLLARVEVLEREIALLLGLGPDDNRDVITDAVATGRPVDALLHELGLTVEADAPDGQGA